MNNVYVLVDDEIQSNSVSVEVVKDRSISAKYLLVFNTGKVETEEAVMTYSDLGDMFLNQWGFISKDSTTHNNREVLNLIDWWGYLAIQKENYHRTARQPTIEEAILADFDRGTVNSKMYNLLKHTQDKQSSDFVTHTLNSVLQDLPNIKLALVRLTDNKWYLTNTIVE